MKQIFVENADSPMEMMEEMIFECNSSQISHQHCMDIMMPVSCDFWKTMNFTSKIKKYVLHFCIIKTEQLKRGKQKNIQVAEANLDNH